MAWQPFFSRNIDSWDDVARERHFSSVPSRVFVAIHGEDQEQPYFERRFSLSDDNIQNPENHYIDFVLQPDTSLSYVTTHFL